MSSEDSAIVRAIALVCLVIVTVILSIAWVETKNGPLDHAKDSQSMTEETRRLTVCVENGGNWTDINERSNRVTMGCIQK